MRNTPTRVLIAMVVVVFIAGCAGTAPEPTADEPIAADPVSTEAVAKEVSEPAGLWLPTEEVVAYTDGTIDKVSTMKYDPSGRILEAVENDGQGNLIRSRRWTYDSGSLVSVELADDGGLVAVTLVETEDNGRVIQEIRQNPTGKVIGSLAYKYDDGDRVVGSVSYDGLGAPLLETTYVYRGDLLTRVEFSIPGDSSDGYIEKIYDGDRLVREETFGDDDVLEKAVEYEYDRGQVVKETYYTGSRPDMAVHRTYDAQGNAVEERWSTGTGEEFEVVTRTYAEFDTGNGG